jgi:hypothetical protein
MPKTEGRLPDFIIVGATKAGTTSLDFYLSLHPEIHMARPKEPRFFIAAAEPLGRWGKGEGWYRDMFPNGKRICGEASPAYTHSPALQGVPERMARLVPNAKLIYLVREPMDRLKSHYLMQFRQNAENLPLADFLLKNPESRCLLASYYGFQLQTYLEWFPMAQILVIESVELACNRSSALKSIFEFLGVDPHFSTPFFKHRRNVGTHQRIPSATGHRVLNSRGMKCAKRILPDSVFYHLQNLVLRPFAGKPPMLELPQPIRTEILSRFSTEVQLLRKLSGQPLPSLDDK